MEHPEQFLGCCGVLNMAMIIICSIYVILGFMGYWKYGEAAEGSVTLNLPPQDM